MSLEITRAESNPRFHRVAVWCAVGVLVLSALFFLVRTFIPSLTQMTHSFPAYYTASRLVLTGEWDARVYDDAWFGERVLELTNGQISERISMNPPTTSLLLIPLAWLSLSNARIIWQLLNLVFLCAALLLLARALQVGLSVWTLFFAAFALVYPPLVENFRVGQVYVLILLLFSFTFWSETMQKQNLAGIALGIALNIKPSGVPILLLMLVRRNWRAVAVTIGVGLVLAVSSLAILGLESWLAFFRRAADYASAPLAAHVAYQTVPSFFQHLFAPSAQFNPTPLFTAPSLAPILALLFVITALAITLWIARRAPLDLAFGAVVTLAVILFPLATEYHYTLLLLPLAVMSKHLSLSRTRFEILFFLIVLLLLCIPMDWNAPHWNEPTWSLLAYPRFYGGILLWAWLVRKMNHTTHELC